MAKLCSNCEKKSQPPNIHRGQCQAQASPDCKAWTEDFAFTLCNPCSEQLEQCSWCLGSIYGGKTVEVPTNKQFVRLYTNDQGSHTPGMNMGEQVLVQLMIDMSNGYTWKFDKNASSNEVSFYGFRLIRDPQNWRQGTLELYVNLDGINEAAKIVFAESPEGSAWWTPPPTGKKWDCTVEILR